MQTERLILDIRRALDVAYDTNKLSAAEYYAALMATYLLGD